MSNFEIRRDDNGELDEIVVKSCLFHMERMGKDQWFISANRGSLRIAVWITGKPKLSVSLEDTEGRLTVER